VTVELSSPLGDRTILDGLVVGAFDELARVP